jgi:hypothetical protein
MEILGQSQSMFRTVEIDPITSVSGAVQSRIRGNMKKMIDLLPKHMEIFRAQTKRVGRDIALKDLDAALGAVFRS